MYTKVPQNQKNRVGVCTDVNFSIKMYFFLEKFTSFLFFFVAYPNENTQKITTKRHVCFMCVCVCMDLLA